MVSKILEITIILAIPGIVPRDPPWGLFKPRLSRARGHALKIIGPCYGGVHPGKTFSESGEGRRGEPRFIVETGKGVEIFLWDRLFFSFLSFFTRQFLRPLLFPSRRGGFVCCVNVDGNLNSDSTSTLFTGIFEVFEVWCLL